jgi:hypothetical protein
MVSGVDSAAFATRRGVSRAERDILRPVPDDSRLSILKQGSVLRGGRRSEAYTQRICDATRVRLSRILCEEANGERLFLISLAEPPLKAPNVAQQK